MRLFVACVRDSAVNQYGAPLAFAAPGQASRYFADEVNKNGSEWNRHPEDYELFQLGYYDMDTGDFECTRPVLISRGKDVVIRPSTPQMSLVS